MGKLTAILKLTRIEHSIMLVIAVIAGELIASHGVLPATVQLMASFITPIFISAAAFAINDYYDIKADKLNNKKRPLVDGSLKPADALWITAISLIIGVGASLFINILAFVIALIFAALAVLYSVKLKEVLLLGNAYIAFSMAIPFIFGNYVVTHVPNYAVILVAIMVFLSGLAREIHGTVRDFKGDVKARNSLTLPRVAGRQAASVIAMLLYIAAIVISAYLFLYLMPFQGNYAYLLLVGINDLMLAYVSIGFVSGRGQKFYDKSRNVSLAAIGMALIAILVASIAYL